LWKSPQGSASHCTDHTPPDSPKYYFTNHRTDSCLCAPLYPFTAAEAVGHVLQRGALEPDEESQGFSRSDEGLSDPLPILPDGDSRFAW